MQLSRSIFFLLLWGLFLSLSWGDEGIQEPKNTRALLDDLYPVIAEEPIAKGHFVTGVTTSLLHSDIKDLDIAIADLYKLEGYVLTVEVLSAYFLKDALAVGLRGGYNRTKYDLDFAALESLIDLKQERNYLSHGFFVTPFFRNYLKLFDTRQLYFFNDLSLTYEYSTGLSTVDDGEELNKGRHITHSFLLGMRPGVSIFLVKGFAFETSVALLGLRSSLHSIEENDQGRKSRLNTNIINFKISLLALNFSLGYYF